MIATVTQRWREGRATYRPAGETIDPSAYEVAPILEDRVARAFVVAHHYAASYPAARFRFGLHRASELVGVAVFSVPVQTRALAPIVDFAAASEAVELGRLVLLDEEPANAESWFLARCFERLRAEGLAGVVSFSDPEARTTADGRLVFPGHVGTIYQASNATYLGRASRNTLRLLPDGTAFHNRAAAKVRNGERGWRYAAAILERHGASPPGDDPRGWLEEWLPRLTRPMRHEGNHKYAWALRSRDRRHLPSSRPYPKLGDGLLFPRAEVTS